MNNLENIKVYAKKLGYRLVEFQAPILDSNCKPIGETSYRLVDESGKIITYGTLETINAYFQMNNRF